MHPHSERGLMLITLGIQLITVKNGDNLSGLMRYMTARAQQRLRSIYWNFYKRFSLNQTASFQPLSNISGPILR